METMAPHEADLQFVMPDENTTIQPPDVSNTDGSFENNTVEREKPMERLNKKVDLVFQLSRVIAELKKRTDIKPTEVESEIDRAWSEFTSQFFQNTVTGYNRQLQIEDELRDIYARLNQWEDEDFLTNFTTNKALAMQLEQESAVIMADEDVQFVRDVSRVLSDLKGKNQLIESLREQPDRLLQSFNSYISPKKLKPNDLHKITFTPFDIFVYLKPGKYNRFVGKDSWGLHFRPSPFSVIQRRYNDEAIAVHEGVHNLIDSSLGIGQIGSREIHLKSIRSESKKANRPEMKSLLVEDLLEFDPTNLLNQAHDEILANLPAWEESSVGKNKLDPFQWVDQKLFPLQFHALFMATAGRFAKQVVDTYKTISHSTTNPETKQQLRQNREQFEKLFLQTIGHMQQALKRARELGGDDVVERIRAAMFVLPPSRYRHLDRYLDYLTESTQ